MVEKNLFIQVPESFILSQLGLALVIILPLTVVILGHT